jgi:purine-binding chemotaxis protein CheW
MTPQESFPVTAANMNMSAGELPQDQLQDQLQVLMLGIGDETLAIETRAVREIIDPVPTTPVPGARPFVPALVNVRGSIIPLVDLHIRFGLTRAADTRDTRIVVLETTIEEDQVILAVVADRVHEVTTLSIAQTQQTPRIGARWRPELIRFMARWNDDFVVVPDLEALFS